MQKKTVAFSKDASNLFFHILTRCNLSCSHCYINPDQHGNNTLSIDTIQRWLGLFAQKAFQTNLIFLGGEPTLHKELSAAVKHARRLEFHSITIDTNGFLFHDILEKITPADVDAISFSLDGATCATNDIIRGKGSYDAVVSGIHRAKKKGFVCSMIYTVSDKNLHELSRMPDLVASLDIDRFFIQVIGMRGKSAGTGKNTQVSKTLWLSVIPKVAETIAQTGVIVTYPKVFLDTADTFACAGIVADNYFVFPNGRVYRCPLCEDYPLHAFTIVNNKMVPAPPVNETHLFDLTIPEGCVMNKIIQPGNLDYLADGTPAHRIACCMLKQEIRSQP
ncbi:MAG TPA: radical SAM protein [Desulfotignum sp.]|nr:radical SAM protein [Desulfotignum sp.]